MIKVQITSKNGNIQKIEIKGHANSAPYGEDLVCAATSAVVTGCCNALNNIEKFNIKLNEGHSIIEVINDIDEHDKIVLDVLIKGLETIAEDNNKFIQIKEN